MRKLFHQIHLWISVPFGLLITLICFSGAMLVFEKEIMESVNHELYFVDKTTSKPLPIAQLMKNVAASLPDSAVISGVNISSDNTRAYQVTLSNPRRASVYVDQYTGHVKGMYKRAPFFSTMFSMHRWMMGSMKMDGSISWGKMVVGTSVLLFVIVLISGIVIWWPRSIKSLRKRLNIRIKNGWKPFWYDLHVAGGMYALVFLLAMALTGLTWSFGWYKNGFYKLFGVENTQRSRGGAHNSPSDRNEKSTQYSVETTHKGRGGDHNSSSGRRGKPSQAGVETSHNSRGGDHNPHSGRKGKSSQSGTETTHKGRGGNHNSPSGRIEELSSLPEPYAQWQQVYEQTAALNPGYKQISISGNTASVTFDHFGNQRASDKYKFNEATGKIIDASLYKDSGKAGKIRGWIYSVHVGSFGGLFTRILAFLAALFGASLPLTGYYLWIKRIYRKKKKGTEVLAE